MANEVEIDIKGNDHATRVMNNVAASARRNARSSALAWTVAFATLPGSAAVAGAAIAGVGASFIGLGAVALRNNNEVKASVIGLGRTIDQELAQDAAPLADAFVQATGKIGAGFEKLRPQMREAFADSVPLVDILTDGVIGFAENAMPGMVRAVDRAEPVMEGFGSLAADVGTGLSDFFDEISSHSEEAGRGIEHLGDLFEGTLPEMGGIIGNLTDLWAEHGGQVVDTITRVLSVLNNLSGGALPVLGDSLSVALSLLNGVLDVIEPITGALGPMIGAWLSLNAAFKATEAVKGIVVGLGGIIGDLGDKMDKSSRKAGLLKAGLLGAAIAVASVTQESTDLNADIAALTSNLENFEKTGKLSGEAARILGQDMQQLKDAFDVAAEGNTLEQLTDSVGNLVGMTSGLDVANERIHALDEALAGLAKQGRASEALAILREVADETGISLGDLRERLPELDEALSTTSGNFNETGDATQYATEALDGYLESLQAATDPVFALNKAIQDVDEAQRSYTEAVREYGDSSPQARQASLDLAEAVSKAEAAALNGDLSFQDFETQLQSWVNQGAITGKQADDIRARVNNLRGAADNYRGTYKGNFVANTAGAFQNVQQYLHKVNQIPPHVSTTVTTIFTSIGTGPTAANRLLSSTGFAHGGVVGAAQAGGPQNGMTLVGEQGPELVNLPTGSVVRPHGETRAVLERSGMGGSPPVIVKISMGDGSKYIRALMEDLRENIRIEYGGNEHEALGQN